MTQQSETEALAAILCNAFKPREIAGQVDAPCFAHSSSKVRRYWLAVADEVAEWTTTLNPTRPS